MPFDLSKGLTLWSHWHHHSVMARPRFDELNCSAPSFATNEQFRAQIVALLIEDIDQNYKCFVRQAQNVAYSAIAMDSQNHQTVVAPSWSVEGMVHGRLEVASVSSAALAAEIELQDLA